MLSIGPICYENFENKQSNSFVENNEMTITFAIIPLSLLYTFFRDKKYSEFLR